MKVLAAIDDSAAAQPVLDVARRLGELIVARVESVHVQEDGSGENATGDLAAAHVPLHVRHGDIVSVLRSEASERDVVTLVIGTRGVPAGPSPAGHVAIDLVQSLDRPIVVVPPHATDRPLRSVLVAVEGDGESHALGRLFEQLGNRATPEVIALHVTEPSNLPPFADSAVHEADAFAREFMIRSASGVVPDLSRIRFEMRVGDPADAVREAGTRARRRHGGVRVAPRPLRGPWSRRTRNAGRSISPRRALSVSRSASSRSRTRSARVRER